MAEFGADVERLEEQLVSLEANIAGTAQMTAVFQQELNGMQHSISLAEREARGFSRSLSRGMRSALGDVILEGAKFSDVLGSLAQTMIRTTFNQAVSPVTDAISGILTGGVNSIFGAIFPSANGNAFAGGRITPFANGGVVNGPTVFPMRGGTGLMGEAGPEAILPLSRGADGRLGVKGGGGGGVHVTMNITTPDADSFRRSQTQVAAGLSRAISRGNRNQ
ncbi:phage tail tape measure protein [Amylibacter sp. IMCC11727]|uniref:phage tail tape measure protein n=1 Tax=Amylibacter sp. IMCC11727 TaxID=3039851 RepID=UPI00244DC526|nr:phage tail tape measure protein [Amylibacter sp. IMCC11727]WGI20832.1 phage tail tape measure protein [Amylibacter sp. IMCC11727]